MKDRLPKITMMFLVPMLILVGLLTISALAKVDKPAGVDARQTVQDEGNGPTLIARRLTSIPFGIDPVLNINAEGKMVDVTGPGECTENGQTYRIQVMVTQNGQQTRAIGQTQGNCDNLPGWSATAMSPGMHSLTEGAAQVCAKVIIFGEPNGSLVGDWCKDVTLTE